MFVFASILLAFSLLWTRAMAHMQLVYPAPFNASNNPHRGGPADPYLQYPYDCCGEAARWENPCRGYLSLLGTPEGQPTAEWEVGSTQSWSIAGEGNHYGGSCQIGFSTDAGKTFRVATSYQGNCPRRNGGNETAGQTFNFTVPHELPAGTHVFAWAWYNREQEFNMNCAAVKITSRTVKHFTQQQAFTSRPKMLLITDKGNCKTPWRTSELLYPDPGTDVVEGDLEYPLAGPQGQCR